MRRFGQWRDSTRMVPDFVLVEKDDLLLGNDQLHERSQIAKCGQA
jgi:hypothetical protein